MILLIVLSRIVSESLCAFFPLSHNAVMIMVYLSFAAVFLVVYKCKLQSYIRCALDGFSGGNVRILAIFALMAYFGMLFVTDVWAPWNKLTLNFAMLNISAVVVPLCGYGLAFRIANEHGRVLRLEHKIGYDCLTGLKNRYSMYKDAQEFMLRTSGGLHVLFLDLDSFKSINDTYGHSAGDEYLRRFARKGLQIIGDDGGFYRLGGDEFVALYCGNDVDSICRKMEEGFEGSNLCPAFVGISIGKTTVYKFEEFENAVFEADKAMYDVKFNKNKRCNV